MPEMLRTQLLLSHASFSRCSFSPFPLQDIRVKGVPEALRNQLQRRGVGKLAVDLVSPKQPGLERVFQMLLGWVRAVHQFGCLQVAFGCLEADWLVLPGPQRVLGAAGRALPCLPVNRRHLSEHYKCALRSGRPFCARPYNCPTASHYCSTTIVTDTAEQARDVAFGAQRHKVVSLDGTLINKAGIITGGCLVGGQA